MPSVEATYFDPKYCQTAEETIVFLSPIDAICGNLFDDLTANEVVVAKTEAVTAQLVTIETSENEFQGSVLD